VLNLMHFTRVNLTRDEYVRKYNNIIERERERE